MVGSVTLASRCFTQFSPLVGGLVNKGDGMETKEFFGFKNHVKATLRDKDGNIIHEQEGYNTVTNGDPDSVNNGFVLILDRMFNNGDFYDPDDYINKMKLGTGTPSNSGLGSPTSSYKTISLDTIDKSTPSAPFLKATGTWDSGDGALSGITEAGLFADGIDTTLFAFKTFTPALSKTAEGTLTIEWTITIS